MTFSLLGGKLTPEEVNAITQSHDSISGRVVIWTLVFLTPKHVWLHFVTE